MNKICINHNQILKSHSAFRFEIVKIGHNTVSRLDENQANAYRFENIAFSTRPFNARLSIPIWYSVDLAYCLSFHYVYWKFSSLIDRKGVPLGWNRFFASIFWLSFQSKSHEMAQMLDKIHATWTFFSSTAFNWIDCNYCLQNGWKKNLYTSSECRYFIEIGRTLARGTSCPFCWWENSSR